MNFRKENCFEDIEEIEIKKPPPKTALNELDGLLNPDCDSSHQKKGTVIRNEVKNRAATVNDKIDNIGTMETEEYPSQYWKCQICTFENESSQQKCAMCESEKIYSFETSTEPWDCKNCGYHNMLGNAKCDICKFRKNQLPTKRVDVKPSSSDSKAKIVEKVGTSSKVNSTVVKDKQMRKPSSDVKADPSKVFLKPSKPEKFGAGDKFKSNEVKTEMISRSGAVKKRKVTWSCPKCTLENVEDIKACQACGYLRKPKDMLVNGSVSNNKISASTNEDQSQYWQCKRCTLKNSITAHVCEVCGNKKEVRLPSEDDIAGFDPSTLDDTVIISESPEKPKEKPGPSTSKTKTSQEDNTSDWKCPRCTFDNVYLVTNCAMCSFKNPKAPKQDSANGE